MKRKTVNLPEVQAALDRIAARTSKAGIEVKKRTAQFLAGDLPALEADMVNEKMEHVAIWLPAGFLEKAEGLVPRFAVSEQAALMGKITRSDVLRLALAKGIESLEAELPAAGPLKPKRDPVKKPKRDPVKKGRRES